MKIEDMILVTDNNKGSETNFLASFEDYIKIIAAAFADSVKEMAYAIAELYETKHKPNDWSEIYFMANKTYHARFCADESQLRGFLLGDFNEEHNEEIDITFDEGRCSKECFDVLKAYDMKTDGHTRRGFYEYETIDNTFKPGEIIHNMNGSDYRVLDVLKENNLLLMSQKTGEICLGIDTQYMAKRLKGEEITSDSVIYGVSWGHGVYLGWNITDIDFERIRKEYGDPEKIESISDYRNSLKKTFFLYKNLMENELLTAEVRNAATNSIYAEFETGREEVFFDHLEDGKYDSGFYGKAVERSGKTR